MKNYDESTDPSPSNGKQHRATRFTPGQRVPASGTYRVIHAHPMRPEISLLAGGLFPRCAQCRRVVEFELMSAVPLESAQNRFRWLMQES